MTFYWKKILSERRKIIYDFRRNRHRWIENMTAVIPFFFFVFFLINMYKYQSVMSNRHIHFYTNFGSSFSNWIEFELIRRLLKNAICTFSPIKKRKRSLWIPKKESKIVKRMCQKVENTHTHEHTHSLTIR